MRNWPERRRSGHLVTALATLALLVTLLAGCGAQAQRLPQPYDLAKDQTLKMMLPVDSGQALYEAALDPAVAVYPESLYGTVQPTTLLYDTLVTLDRNAQIEPWGAESWTISPDGLTYTFHLRPNQRFSDGASVKASDYVWSLDRLVNPCLGLLSDTYSGGLPNEPPLIFTAIKDAQALHGEKCVNGQPAGALTSLVGDSVIANDGARTLTIQLAQPTGYFLHGLTLPLVSVVERSVVTGASLGADQGWVWHMADGKTGQGGSGMFYLAKITPGANNSYNELVLKPNPYWWGLSAGKKPYFSEVDLIAIDPSVAFAMFKNDPSIAYGATPNQDEADVKKQPYYHEQPLLSTASLVFNPTTAPFDDINARKAFCLAINREQLQHEQQSYQGDGDSISYAASLLDQSSLIPGWHIVPQGMDGYNANLRGLDGAPVTGNAALAKQYWQRYLAAHHNQAPEIWMNINYGHANIDMALANFWRDTLDVKVTLTAARMQALPPVSSDFQWLDMRAFIDDADPHEAFSWGPSAISGASWVPLAPFGSDMPEADALLQQADGLADMQQRIPLYQRAEQMLIDNATICPLYQRMNKYALRPWVKGGFVEDVRGVFPNDAWVTGYIAKH